MKEVNFQTAIPVWEQGQEETMNLTLTFLTSVGKAASCLLRLTGQSLYHIFVNGTFVALGPARAAHGFYRVDEIDLVPYLTEENNRIAIRVTGYHCNSFYLLYQPSFLCCELIADQKVIAATGQTGFTAYRDTSRVQKTQRYSFQRPFSEVYCMTEDDLRLRRGEKYGEAVHLTPTAPKRFIAREIFLPTYPRTKAAAVVDSGRASYSPEAPQCYHDRSIEDIGEELHGFPPEELSLLSTHVSDCLSYQKDETPCKETVLRDGRYMTFDMGKNLTGMFSLSVIAGTSVRLIALFDEILTEGDVDPVRMESCNVVIWDLAPGHYDLMTVEPYTFRYLKCVVLGGDIMLLPPVMTRVEFDRSLLRPAPPLSDGPIKRVYDAAVESFCQNVFDIYMDCPSRERAGWLCDGFFTGRAEYILTGRSQVEHNFLENFILPDSFACIPEGMLPMCYPADHFDHAFIPNWAMWYVLEFEEYIERSGDRELLEGARTRLYRLLAYFRSFEREDGLLCRLDGVVFVEWSHANALSRDVNFPTNMIYARMKCALGRLYHDESLRKEGEALLALIGQTACDGLFFCDNAYLCEDGSLRLSGEHTETCQYYAFFTGAATPKTHPELWRVLREEFGPDRQEKGRWKEIWPSNAFIGNFLRLEILFSEGLYDEVLENMEGYFDYMAQRTGTLWEHMGVRGSCNHGFTSHVLYWLYHMPSVLWQKT